MPEMTISESVAWLVPPQVRDRIAQAPYANWPAASTIGKDIQVLLMQAIVMANNMHPKLADELWDLVLRQCEAYAQ